MNPDLRKIMNQVNYGVCKDPDLIDKDTLNNLDRTIIEAVKEIRHPEVAAYALIDMAARLMVAFLAANPDYKEAVIEHIQRYLKDSLENREKEFKQWIKDNK